MRTLYTIALVLLVVGGLNWGLVGLFEFDLVATIFGGNETWARIVYVLVGVSALICLGLFGLLSRPLELGRRHEHSPARG